jgi:hypothetical protein
MGTAEKDKEENSLREIEGDGARNLLVVRANALELTWRSMLVCV